MTPQIILVYGPFARDCAAALAGNDGVSLAFQMIGRWWAFEPLRPVFIHAEAEWLLARWHRRATAVIAASSPASAEVCQGRFGSTGRGGRIRWRRWQ